MRSCAPDAFPRQFVCVCTKRDDDDDADDVLPRSAHSQLDAQPHAHDDTPHEVRMHSLRGSRELRTNLFGTHPNVCKYILAAVRVSKARI